MDIIKTQNLPGDKSCTVVLSGEEHSYHGIVSIITHKNQSNQSEKENNKESVKILITCAEASLFHYDITELFLHYATSFSSSGGIYIELPKTGEFEMIKIIFNDIDYDDIKQFYDTNQHFITSGVFTNPSLFYNKQHPEIFQVFSIQAQAFQFFDDIVNNNNLKIYTFESITGKRKFLVADEKRFLEKYIQENMKFSRHVYEIIRENYPCRLYFDIEYHIPTNKSINGIELVIKWVSVVLWKLYEVYGIAIGPDCIIDLDSSTDLKFSRHITFILPDSLSGSNREVLFISNAHIKHFIDLIMEDVTQRIHYNHSAHNNTTTTITNENSSQLAIYPHPTQRQPLAEYDDLWVNPKEGEGRTFIVDLGVYTKNRSFRIFGSSKFGKSACLKFAKEYLPGINSLLKPALQQNGSKQVGTLSDRYNRYKCILRDTYVMPLNSKPIPTHLYESISTSCEIVEYNQHSYLYCCVINNHQGNNMMYSSSSFSSSEKQISAGQGHHASPFPLIDAFVVTLVKQGGIQGEIKSWTWYKWKIIYQINKNKWCGNVGRPHKSNGIMMTIDLYSQVAYQTCWDIDCKGYKSPYIPIPQEMMPTRDELEQIYAKCTNSTV